MSLWARVSQLPAGILEEIRSMYTHDFPIELYSKIVFCLEREQQYVSYPFGCILCVGNPELHKVCTAIKELQNMQHQIENDTSNFMRKFGLLPSDTYALPNVLYLSMDTTTNGQELASPGILAHTQYKIVGSQHVPHMLALVDGFRKIVSLSGDVQAKVLNEYLLKWKTNKLLHLNEACADRECDLGVIQGWCEALAKVLLTTIGQIEFAIENVAKQSMVYDVSGMLAQALDDAKRLIKTLIIETFIIEKQPPQMIKTRNSFAASACLLVGNALDIQTMNPQVKASIISCTQLHRALEIDQPPEQPCGPHFKEHEQRRIKDPYGA
ncbi:uncharacterized protein LOC131215290 [Anopheles bellator]|uniref:uncharacterized protein LOC131215290 n=1 Tax=Anopheles bellator TaxID=139047 RepID=UPI0026483974|nr:uncharacterized protein LOC131215290 [Anopheles bellator]